MDAQIRQAYEVWKKSVEEFMSEMENVMAGQQAGGRLSSVTASMEFNYQLLHTLFSERQTPLP